MNQPKVIIVVLNYNGKADTLACLESLSKVRYSNFETVLVDNASQDGSTDAVRKKFPQVQIIRNRQNLGYAEGNNRGIDWALKNRADYILILNNDTTVIKNFLKELIKVAEKYPKAILFSPQLRYPSVPPRIWYAGGRMFWPIGQLKLYKRGVLVKKIKNRGPFEVNFVSGAAFFVRAKAFEKLGKFDPKFFLYWEETDWCARAQKAHKKFIYVPSSIVYHKEGATTGGPKNAKNYYYFYRNNLLFARKNLPFYWWPTFLVYLILRIFLIELPSAWLFLIILKPYRLISFYYIWLGIFDFIRGKFGRKF